MYDLDLLILSGNKNNYIRFKDYIKKYVVSTVTKTIFDSIGGYYDNYPHRTDIDWKEFYTFFFVIKSTKVKDTAIYDDVINRCASSTGTKVLDDVLAKFIELDYTTQAFNKCLEVQNGTATFEEVEPLLAAYRKEVGSAINKEDIFVSPDLSYLKGVVASGGLEWRLEELNVALGPLRKGDFIIIAARPETGKTTFVASEATYMMEQMKPDEHIVWINNEEASNKVMMRCIQAYHGITSSELMSGSEEATAKFQKAGGDRFLVLDDDSGIKSVNKISALFSQFKPALIIFDQLDKVHGFQNDTREDLRIGKLYEWARDLAKEYCPVIAVSQVDGTGEGEKWIHMNQLRGSKTDKIGEADAIVTIGKSNEAGMDLHRFLHVPKNKLFGGARSLEVHRHGAFELEIVPSIARYKSKWR